MSEVTRWWWIRHAPVNAGGRIYGASDPPADCSDEAMFRRIAPLLPQNALWVVTQLQRTRQTADTLGQLLDPRPPAPLVEPRFAEQSFGDWQGLTHEELRRRRPSGWHRFWLAPAHEEPPGGESFVQMMTRVEDGVRALLRSHAGRDIVCVAHGGPIRAALALALGLEPERALGFAIGNLSLTCIECFHDVSGQVDESRQEAWRVSLVNFPPQIGA